MISETKGTIMVVDDDPLVLESVSGLLAEVRLPGQRLPVQHAWH